MAVYRDVLGLWERSMSARVHTRRTMARTRDWPGEETVDEIKLAGMVVTEGGGR